eukprot:12295-Heterococcus_DN1.PRE.1
MKPIVIVYEELERKQHYSYGSSQAQQLLYVHLYFTTQKKFEAALCCYLGKHLATMPVIE